ncbi:MAG: peptidylprolyl isomerase [bacterium]|nr:peptidylprolyl isomerase [bacterium]
MNDIHTQFHAKHGAKTFVPFVLLALFLIIAGLVYWNTANHKKPYTSTEQKQERVQKPTTQEEKGVSLSVDIKKELLKKPSMEIDPAKKYSAVLTTTKGVITVELFSGKTPITANNFVALARKHFYDGTTFHRVIEGFMVQGGDPKGDGTGGPGYQFNDEPFEGEYTRGTLAMANAGPHTNGSQFFIMHEDYSLPKNYVIFGRVIDGMDVVDAIASSPVKQASRGEYSTPVEPTIVTSVEIKEQ